MAKREKAIYAPGELGRVREKLGVSDPNEAKRMAQLLGGEVGVEKTEISKPIVKSWSRREKVDVMIGGKGTGRPRSQVKRRVDLAADAETEGTLVKKRVPQKLDTLDDPAVPIQVSYWERVKMDKFAGQSEFDIKNSAQVLYSMVSFFGDIPDYVSPIFVTRRMAEYYKRIELLVISTRNLFPRNNLKRNERMKKTSPFLFAILDILRYWNIERISGDLARIQARPRIAKVSDFADILRSIYKPLFILEQLDTEAHIKGAFRLLYKILYIENPMDAKEKYQELIRSALTAYGSIRRDIHYLLYPLLMKLLSDKWLSYNQFFKERKNRFMAFLGVTEDDYILPMAISADGGASKEEPGEGEKEETLPPEDENDPAVQERRAKQNAVEAEKKAVDRGLQTLEVLFPKAGWDQIAHYPDLYPYFTGVFGLKKGYNLISPQDPLLQIVILMRILGELFFGLRHISFGSVIGANGTPERVDEILGKIINDWQKNIELSFDKEYLPRLEEYVRILENTADSRTSNYAKRLVNELHWTKRLYFLPYYKFESFLPPPFQKNEITALYPEIRQLRKYLTAVAAGIEQGNKQGGAEKQAPCDGVDNPWAPYKIEVPNPLSIRLNALLGAKKKNNASLIFFTLAIVTVLDHLVNNEDSWAYEERSKPLFRSVNGEGVTPLLGVDTNIDADALFKQAMKQRQKET
jgi:hypothetical protein